MRLNDALIANERYRGEPSTDEDGRTQWPVCVVWDDEIPGFGVRIHPPFRGKPSRKDFIVTWKTGLRSRTMAIGTFGVDCTLRQARRAAREALDLARRGQDPIEARQRALGIGTAEDLASRFLFEHSAAKKKNIPGGESESAPSEEVTAPVDTAAPAAAASPGGVSVSDAPAEPASAVGAVPDPPEAAPPAPEAAAGGPAAEDERRAATAGKPDVAVPAAPVSPTVPVDTSPVAATATEPTAPTVPVPATAPAAPTAAPTAAPAAALPTPPTVPTPAAVPPPPPPRIESPAAPRRGPTKMRLLSLPDGLHREVERRARASGMTIAGYLQYLLERESEATGPQAPGSEAGAGVPPDPPEVEVASVGADSSGRESDRDS